MFKLLALVSASLLGLSAQAAQVQIAWDSNPEPNIAGYKLYRGTSSGTYDLVQDVGNTTLTTASQLVGGVVYYFALTAYNTDMLESPLSTEISYTPTVTSGSVPLATAASYTLPEDSALPITLAGSDPNGDLITFSIVTAPARGTLSGTPPKVTYQPAANFSGTDSFTFQVSDGGNFSAPATISLTVTPVNDRPVGFSQNRTVNEEGSLAITLGGGDVDGDSITFSIRTQPVHGSLSGTPPNLIYRPATNFTGLDSFTFLVSDGRLFSAITPINISVLAVNDSPTALSQTLNVAQGGTAAVSLGGIDPDGDALTFRIVDLPQRGTLLGTPPNLTYAPAAGFVGSDRFTFTASDASLTSLPATVTFTVTGIVATPTATPQSATILEDGSAAINLSGISSTGLPLNYLLVSQPQNGTLSGTPPSLTYLPARDFFGTDTFSFLVREGTTDSAPAPVTVTVQPVNDSPVAQEQSVSVLQNGSILVTLNATDVEKDPITFTVVQNPAHGVLQGTGASITYTPEAGYAGLDSFLFVASDPSTNSSPATVRISVETQTTVPKGNPDSLVVLQGGSTTQLTDGSSSVLDNDSLPTSGSVMMAQLATSPTNGVLTFSQDGRFRYTHDGDLSVEDSFTYQVSKDGVLSDPVTVRISVFRWTNVARGASKLDLGFSTLSGLSYELQSTSGSPRPDGNWVSVSGLLTGIDGTIRLSRPNPNTITYFRAICRTSGGPLVTEPVGYTIVPVPTGFALLGVPLHTFPTHVDTVSSVSRDTAVFAESFWQPGQFDPQDSFSQYILMVRAPGTNSPARSGDWWPISLTSTDRLRLDTRGIDLRLELQVGDEVEVRRLTSLAELFSGPTGATTLANGDRFTLYSASGTQTDVAYVTAAGTPGTFYTLNPDNTLRTQLSLTSPTVLPGIGFQSNRSGGPLSQAQLGRVQPFGITHYVVSGVELVTTPFPFSTLLDRSGLLESGWVNEVPGSTQVRDELWLISASTPIISVTHRQVTNQNNAWYSNGTWTPTASLAPSKAAWIIVASRTPPFRWRQPLTW